MIKILPFSNLRFGALFQDADKQPAEKQPQAASSVVAMPRTSKTVPLIPRPYFGGQSGEWQLNEEAKADQAWARVHFDNAKKTKSYHRSDAEGDDYSRYGPHNSKFPPALFHTLVEPPSLKQQKELCDVLEKFINQKGERYRDYPFIRERYKVGEFPFSVGDTETTGLQGEVRIVQYAQTHVNPDLSIDYDRDFEALFHPGFTRDGKEFPIQKGATAVHGISLDTVEGLPSFSDALSSLRNDSNNAYGEPLMKERGLYVFYNAKFDVPKINHAISLWEEGHRGQGGMRSIDQALVMDPFVLIQRIHPFVSIKKTLSNHYEILMGKSLENAHDAKADTDGTVDLLKYILLYLEKHMIPLEWAKGVEQRLIEAHGQQTWNEWPNEKKAVAISDYVRHHRKLLEVVSPQSPDKPRFVDILRFQHGAKVLHDNTYYPVFDIQLNGFGYDSQKRWDGEDSLDPKVVDVIRNWRDRENKQYLAKTFFELSRKEFSRERQDQLVESLLTAKNLQFKPDTKPEAREAKVKTTRNGIRRALRQRVAKLVIDDFLSSAEKRLKLVQNAFPADRYFRTAKVNIEELLELTYGLEEKYLPQIVEKAVATARQEQTDGEARQPYTMTQQHLFDATQTVVSENNLLANPSAFPVPGDTQAVLRFAKHTFKQRLAEALMAGSAEILGSKLDPASETYQSIETQVKGYTEDLYRGSKALRDKLGKRYFYSYTPVKPGTLVDPAIITALNNAVRKGWSPKGAPLRPVNPPEIPALRAGQTVFDLAKGPITIDSALIVKKEWLDKILSGEKTWEIRGSNFSKTKGQYIGLVESGSGKIIGVAKHAHTIPLTLEEMLSEKNLSKHQIPEADLRQHGVGYAAPHALELQGAVRLDTPIPYEHKQGTVIWANFPPVTIEPPQAALQPEEVPAAPSA